MYSEQSDKVSTEEIVRFLDRLSARDGAESSLRMTTLPVAGNIVAVILSRQEAPRIVGLLDDEGIAPSIQRDGKIFVDSGIGDWIGFYDWLRDPSGRIIGVRQWVDEPSVALFSEKFVGVEANAAHGVLLAFFGQSRNVDEVASCNQDFGNNRLLLAGDAVALTFSTGAMK